MMCGKAAQLLTLWHGRTPLVARDDDRLRDAGQRILLPQCRRRPEERTHARHNIIVEAALLPRVHLLLYRPVDRGITRMEAHGNLSVGFCLRDNFHHLVQRHMRRVVDLHPFLAVVKESRVDKRPRIDHDIRLRKIA